VADTEITEVKYPAMKIVAAIVGVVSLLFVSCLYYRDAYLNPIRDDRIMLIGDGIAALAGLFCIAPSPGKDVYEGEPGYDKRRRKTIILMAVVVLFAFGCYNYIVPCLETKREYNIITTQPTDTTPVSVYVVYRSSGGRQKSESRIATFSYKASGKHMEIERFDESDKYSDGKYHIRYSVAYPEMFVIYGK